MNNLLALSMFKMTDPCLSSPNNKLNNEEEIVSPRRSIWSLASAIWLQIVVIVFILVQVSHLRRPVSIFLLRTIEYLVKQ